MDDLVTWFRAQLDDEERVAREATQGEWRWTDAGGRFKQALVARAWPNVQMIVPSASPDVYPSRYDAEHIARWDPARVLAEVDAKRKILDEHPNVTDSEWPGCNTCCAEDDRERRHPWPCPTVRLLALPYADRPGFDPLWAWSMIR